MAVLLVSPPSKFHRSDKFSPNQNPGFLKRSCGDSRVRVRVGVRVRVRVRVSLALADCDARVSRSRKFPAPSPHTTLSSTSSLSSSSSSLSCSKQDEDKQNYYLNTGHAIRTLREEFPGLFYRELSFDIYREDIVFKDPLNTFAGIDNYKQIFWALRFHGKIFFKALWIDIISVSQPVENVIMIRWTVHGIPRVPWESHGRFDATSEYKLDKNGKIFEHRVDNFALNSPPPKFRVLAVEELLQAIGCPSTPKPTYFEIVASTRGTNVPLASKITWAQYYLAFNLTLALRYPSGG